MLTDNPENPWKTCASTLIYDNRWISLTEHQVINPSGGHGIYGVVHFKHLAIGILALEDNPDHPDDPLVWLVGQYRYPLKAYSWEIPEGGGPLDLPPLTSAQRELQEETGLIANSWELLLTLHLSNSVSDEVGYVFLARDLHYGEAQPEETEALEVVKIPVSQAYQYVISGRMTDSLTVAGILRLKLYLMGQ